MKLQVSFEIDVEDKKLEELLDAVRRTRVYADRDQRPHRLLSYIVNDAVQLVLGRLHRGEQP